MIPMVLPGPLGAAVASDRVLAEQHEVRFQVVSRASGSGPMDGRPTDHGSFRDPVEAVSLGRSLGGREVTVLADGRGPYWRTAEPDRVNSELLRIVCRDKRLGPDEADREHQRDHWREVIERLEADQRVAEAIAVVHGCDQLDEAERLLRDNAGFSRRQARHLLSHRSLELVTRQGQRKVQAELEEARAALRDLGPSPDVPE